MSKKSDIVFVHAGIELSWMAAMAKGCMHIPNESELTKCKEVEWNKFIPSINKAYKEGFEADIPVKRDSASPLATRRFTEDPESVCDEVTSVLSAVD